MQAVFFSDGFDHAHYGFDRSGTGGIKLLCQQYRKESEKHGDGDDFMEERQAYRDVVRTGSVELEPERQRMRLLLCGNRCAFVRADFFEREKDAYEHVCPCAEAVKEQSVKPRDLGHGECV